MLLSGRRSRTYGAVGAVYGKVKHQMDRRFVLRCALVALILGVLWAFAVLSRFSNDVKVAAVSVVTLGFAPLGLVGTYRDTGLSIRNRARRFFVEFGLLVMGSALLATFWFRGIIVLLVAVPLALALAPIGALYIWTYQNY